MLIVDKIEQQFTGRKKIKKQIYNSTHREEAKDGDLTDSLPS